MRAYYTEMVRSRTNFLGTDVDRVVVDDQCVVSEGFVKQVYPGAEAMRLGFPVDDPGEDYLLVFRTLVVMPVDGDGLIEGEDIYLSGLSRTIKLSPSDLPKAYASSGQAQPG